MIYDEYLFFYRNIFHVEFERVYLAVGERFGGGDFEYRGRRNQLGSGGMVQTSMG